LIETSVDLHVLLSQSCPDPITNKYFIWGTGDLVFLFSYVA